MSSLTKSLLLLATLLLLVATALGQPLPEPRTGPTLERLLSYPLIHGRSPSGPALSPDGSKMVFGWNKTGARLLDVYVMDFPGGKPQMIVESASIEELPRQDDTRTDLERRESELYDGGIASFQWSPDSGEIMMGPYKGRLWLANPDGSNFRPLFDTTEAVSGAQYSPDGRYIAFLRNQNVFRVERATGAVRQLTFVSRPQTNIDSILWSPDSQHIAVTWSDSSRLGSHVMMDFSKDRAEVINIRRMWHGDASQNMQIGIVGVDGGLIDFFPNLPRYMWMNSWAWAPDSSALAFTWLSEDFKKVTITSVPMTTKRPYTIHTIDAPKNFLTDFHMLEWTRDSSRIYFTTDVEGDAFGRRGVWSITRYGRDLQPVFVRNFDIAAMERPKDSDDLILVTQRRSPLKSEILVLKPDGTEEEYVPIEDGSSTPFAFDYANPPMFSDDGSVIATMASKPNLNPELYSIKPQMERLTYSQTEEFNQLEWAEIREVQFPGPDGVTLHGLLYLPPNLDTNRKYPAYISNMYANSAKATWKGYFENYGAMNLDMVALQVDFRASFGHGGEFNTGYYESMGIIDTQEAVAAKNYLVSLGYIDEENVGCHGWSYGGFLACMIMLTAPGEFKAGVAVASVTDWHSYNEWYTRRRLGLYSENKEIYEATSPIYHAEGLEDHLLLIHGMLDPNVLFQDTARLMQRLIEAGKYFDVMAYPREDHGIWREEARPHVYITIMRYLYENLQSD